MQRTLSILALFAGAIISPASADAAFIVEAHSTGKANVNFALIPGAGNGTAASASTAVSTAVGLSASGSVFGSNNTTPNTTDIYQYSYTPGTNADNTVLAAATSLGNSEATDPDGAGAGPPVYASLPQLATGLVGGQSGIYNVYFTTPSSSNVNVAGSKFDIASNAGTITLSPVVLNDGNTGPDEVAGTPFTGGANNRWLKLGSAVLTAGTTYTVTQTSNVDAFTSQRAHGVMWEYVGPVPEPSSIILLALSAVSLIGYRRREIAK